MGTVKNLCILSRGRYPGKPSPSYSDPRRHLGFPPGIPLQLQVGFPENLRHRDYRRLPLPRPPPHLRPQPRLPLSLEQLLLLALRLLLQLRPLLLLLLERAPLLWRLEHFLLALIRQEQSLLAALRLLALALRLSPQALPHSLEQQMRLEQTFLQQV